MGRPNKEGLTKEQLAESTSIYKRIDEYRSAQAQAAYDTQLQEKVDDGTYDSIEEAKANMPVKEGYHTLMMTLCGKSLPKSTPEEKIFALDKIIRDVMEITPQTFCNIYSTSNNKRFKIYNLIDSIVDSAPEEIVIKACFNQKAILFNYMYPDLDFGTQLEEVDGAKVFFCTDTMRAGLCKAANTLKVATTKSSKIYTQVVDKILMQAIDDVVFGDEVLKKPLETAEEIFMFLGEEAANFYCKDKSKRDINRKPAGINFVVEKRYNGGNLLDFYYLNAGPEFQHRYCHEFHHVREMFSDILPENPDLDRAVRFLMKKYPHQEKKQETSLDIAKKLDMPERLFWVEVNEREQFVTGYLLNEEQLADETNTTAADFDALKSKKRGLMGAYSRNLSYIVHELHSMEDVYNALTWQKFSYEDDITTEQVKMRYPSFVAKDLKLSSMVLTTTGYTATTLPLSGEDNETVSKYQDMLKLSEESLECKYTKKDQAKIAILNELVSSTLTETKYNKILDEYGLKGSKQTEEEEEEERDI